MPKKMLYALIMLIYAFVAVYQAYTCVYDCGCGVLPEKLSDGMDIREKSREMGHVFAAGPGIMVLIFCHEIIRSIYLSGR